jgi:hypothetical protein
VTGEVLSSSNMNTHVRDNLLYLGGADGIVGSPPGTPGNGQTWIYPADAASGTYWTFIYIAAIGVWVFTGGHPLRAYDPNGVATSSGSYAVLGSCQLTIPRTGAYELKWGWWACTTTYIGSDRTMLDYNGGALDYMYGTAAGDPWRHGHWKYRIESYSAGAYMRMQHYSTDTNNAMTWYGRIIRLLPRTVS